MAPAAAVEHQLSRHEHQVAKLVVGAKVQFQKGPWTVRIPNRQHEVAAPDAHDLGANARPIVVQQGSQLARSHLGRHDAIYVGLYPLGILFIAVRDAICDASALKCFKDGQQGPASTLARPYLLRGSRSR